MNDPGSRLLLPPRTEKKDRKWFGTPVQLIYFSACIACTFVDFVLILVALLAYFYPNPFRKSPIYKQFLQKMDRFTVQFWYNIVQLALAFFFLLHIISLGLSLMSIQTRRPWLFIPQLVLGQIVVLLFLFISAVSFTISIVSDDSMWLTSILALLLLIAYGIFLALAVLSFQQLLYEYEDLKRMLASSRTVHFKEERKRRK